MVVAIVLRAKSKSKLHKIEVVEPMGPWAMSVEFVPNLRVTIYNSMQGSRDTLDQTTTQLALHVSERTASKRTQCLPYVIHV
jgi:hypothetical protein